MLTYTGLTKKDRPLYQQIYNQIRADITAGRLNTGERLPSKRSLAKNLGVSVITVENAYAQLIAEGYVYSLNKKGYFVAVTTQAQFYTSCQEAGTISTDDVQEPVAVDLATNQTNPEQFPFALWAKLLREVISHNRDELMTNPPSAGVAELRSAIARHLRQFRGMEVREEQIIIGAGTEYLYDLLIKLLGRDCRYAVEDPGYHKLSRIYQANGVKSIAVPIDKHGLTLAPLMENKIDIAHLTPSHHYPTGRIMPVSRRYELLNWAAKEPNRYIIEDDYDSEFRFLGRPIPSMQSIDTQRKVIYLNTFTKTLASTMRIGYLVLPLQLVQKYHDRLGFCSCPVPTFEQYTLARFISEGYFEKHLNRMRNYYRKQKDLLLKEIYASNLGKIGTISEAEAGLHFLLKLDTRICDEELINRASRLGLKISCLSQYYYQPRPKMEHTLVINYSRLPMAKIPLAVYLLNQCLEE